MNDRELLEFIAAQVGNLTQKLEKIDARTTNLEVGQKRVERILTAIENAHGKKLQALIDESKQHTDILERIEMKVINRKKLL